MIVSRSFQFCLHVVQIAQ